MNILGWLFGGKDPSKACSKEALDKIDTEKMREKVEAAYYVLPAGATADEIAAEMNESILSIRPRVSELKNKVLWPTGERRRNKNGNSCAVLIHYKNMGGAK
jgi:beta-lactamase superfamily II metal-dependent hydrolase